MRVYGKVSVKVQMRRSHMRWIKTELMRCTICIYSIGQKQNIRFCGGLNSQMKLGFHFFSLQFVFHHANTWFMSKKRREKEIKTRKLFFPGSQEATALYTGKWEGTRKSRLFLLVWRRSHMRNTLSSVWGDKYEILLPHHSNSNQNVTWSIFTLYIKI